MHYQHLMKNLPLKAYPLPAGSGLLQDLAFLSFTLPEVESSYPKI